MQTNAKLSLLTWSTAQRIFSIKIFNSTYVWAFSQKRLPISVLNSVFRLYVICTCACSNDGFYIVTLIHIPCRVCRVYVSCSQLTIYLPSTDTRCMLGAACLNVQSTKNWGSHLTSCNNNNNNSIVSWVSSSNVI